ncbi:hypothetical protein C5167_040178 [Papaver somniferum]|uniref:Uncharacterized protein n=1 Tax=Papaver somniferum TaxID=3469 RepID=A0A4Y7IED3_PAPSO|nr:hypothetical protein C5167_040178 [Papaver somniferum]
MLSNLGVGGSSPGTGGCTEYRGDNRFSGLLPSSISNASRLSTLDVVNNHFTGPVPPNLGTLQSLGRLNIGGNNFGAGKADDLSFFRSLSNCSRLEHFSMAFNNLSGQLPDSMANYSAKLSTIYIGTNHIFGSIPSGLENLVSLNGLAMEHNMLTGSIPESIGTLSNLVIVSMWGNQLSGVRGSVGYVAPGGGIKSPGTRWWWWRVWWRNTKFVVSLMAFATYIVVFMAFAEFIFVFINRLVVLKICEGFNGVWLRKIQNYVNSDPGQQSRSSTNSKKIQTAH